MNNLAFQEESPQKHVKSRGSKVEVEDRRSGGNCFHWDPQLHRVEKYSEGRVGAVGRIGCLHFAVLFDEMLGSLYSYNLSSRPSLLDPTIFTIYMFPLDIVSTLMISL